MLLGLEVARKRLAPSRLGLRLRRALGHGLVGRLGALFERALLLPFHNGRWHGRRQRDCRASLTLLALRYGEKLGNALVETRELLEKCASWPRSAAFSFRSAFSSSTDEYRSHLGICVDRLVYFFEPRAPVPASPSRHEVDAGQQRSEGGTVDRDLRLATVERRQLKTAGFEAFR